MFICQRVYENEIIIISNAYKIMDNIGYLNSFKLSNLKENIFNDDNFDKNDNENILCLDATFKDHYTYKSVLQDFSKFYIACEYCSKKYENAGISTGSWGCGFFWCDKADKFLQQLVCSKCNNVKLFTKLNIYIFLIAKLYLLPLTTVNYSFFIHYHANTELFLITSNIKTLKLFSFISVFFI